MYVAEFFRKFSFLRKDTVMKNESWDVQMDGDMVIAGLSERTRRVALVALQPVWREPQEVQSSADKLGSVEQSSCRFAALFASKHGYPVLGQESSRPRHSIQSIGTPTVRCCSYQRAELQRQSTAFSTRPALTGLRWMYSIFSSSFCRE
jgi:hypothetical protein